MREGNYSEISISAREIFSGGRLGIASIFIVWGGANSPRRLSMMAKSIRSTIRRQIQNERGC
jgi:hypothetical protein